MMMPVGASGGTCVLKIATALTRMQVACVCLLGAHCDAQKYARVNAFKLHFDNIIGKSVHNTATTGEAVDVCRLAKLTDLGSVWAD